MLWLVVGPTGVNLLDFFCSGIQFYLLLSPYLCFISLLYIDLYVLGDDALWGWRREIGLSPPVKYCTDRSKAVLLLWIFYVFRSCVCYVFVCVCLYVLCGHLLGNGWPLGSRMWCLTVSLSLFHWYPGSGVVLDCIDSWSLHSYFLHSQRTQRLIDTLRVVKDTPLCWQCLFFGFGSVQSKR